MDKWLGNRLVDGLSNLRRGNLIARLKGQIEGASTDAARNRLYAILGRVMAA